MRFVALFVIVCLCLVSVAEAGIFRRRDGSPRRPFRNAVHAVAGGCANGSCSSR